MSLNNLLDKVKKLREITGVGFKDCKHAIDENNGDIEKSIEFLRKKGIANLSQNAIKEGIVVVDLISPTPLTVSDVHMGRILKLVLHIGDSLQTWEKIILGLQK